MQRAKSNSSHLTKNNHSLKNNYKNMIKKQSFRRNKKENKYKDTVIQSNTSDKARGADVSAPTAGNDVQSNISDKASLGWAGKISYFFIKNSQLSILLIITIFVWGLLSFILTPKQYDPKITAPSFQVKLQAPSAESAEFYDRITRVFEDGILDIPTVEDVISQTKEGGSAVITTNFYVGEDEEESNIKLRQKVDELRNNVPSVVNKVESITIKSQDPDDVPIVSIAILSENKSLVELREVAIEFSDILKNVSQVTNVQIHGGEKRELKVTLNPLKLDEYKIDPRIIVTKISQNSYRYFVSDEFQEQQDAENRKVVEINALFQNPEEAENLVITKTAGENINLGDIATIEHAVEEQQSFIRFKDKEIGEQNVVYLSLAKEDGSNITVVSNNIIERIGNLQIPNGVDLQIVRNDGEVANAEIISLTQSLFIAIIIVASVLFLFLGWRPALTAALAIPLTISVVFGVALISGQTINRITLFALILSLGLLVDNATVVVENTVRHLGLINKKNRYNNNDIRNPREAKNYAVAKAVGEVGTGLALATLTTLLAFYPMAFVTGMMGPYMGPIPFFVPAALLASLFIALTLNPFIISKLMNKKQEGQEGAEQLIADTKKKVVEIKNTDAEKKEKTGVQGVVGKFFDRYSNTLDKVLSVKKLRHSILWGTLALVLIALSLPIFQIVKFRMLPKDDKEKMFVYLDYKDDATLDKNLELTKEVEDLILNHTDVKSVQTFVSTSPIVDFNGMFRGVTGRIEKNQSTIKINLKEDRSLKSEEVALELRPVLNSYLEKNKEANLTIVEDAPGPPVRSTAMITVTGENRANVNEENLGKLKQIVADFEQIFLNTNGVVDIDTTVREPIQTISYKIDLEKAGSIGLSTFDIIHNLDIALNGRVATLYRDTVDKEKENVFVTFPKEYETDLQKLEDIKINYVPTTKTQINEDMYKVQVDNQVRLGDVASLEFVERDNFIPSQNKDIAYSVQAEMGERSVTYAAIDVLQEMWDYKLPWTQNSERISFSLYEAVYEDKDTGFRYKVTWDGEWELTLDVFRDLGLAMIVAIFLIYAVLVAQFKSFKIGLLILATVPLGLIGVMPGYAILFQINGLYFNATSMIGVIALAGIVVNNAIIMVDYLNQVLKGGIGLKEAIIQTAATRLRPIVLTALTTVLGSLTLVTDPVWAGLGWSIVLGMTFSTILTLFVFPIMYYAVMKTDVKKV